MSLSKADPAFIDGVLVDGAARARAIAAANMACVKEILGFVQ
jgi:tryptophanyl-tRNA synthetase